jgi:adenylosuccinate synthase
VIGVAKAYVTRVGAGPFPSEADEERGARIREIGGEYGVTTGRSRRCGWLDLVGLRYARRLNGMTELVLTKLDVLSGFPTIPVCVAYRLPDGSETGEFPMHQSDFHHAQPVFEELPGWNEDLSDVTAWDDLPAAARDYVSWVEARLGVPVTMVGVGQRRDQILAPHGEQAIARGVR